MEEVLEYLQMKNQYYEKFLSVTIKLLEQARRNQWDELEFYVDNRERILNIIRSFDHKIARVFKDESLSDTEMELYRPQVKRLLQQRAEIANRIVAVDLELISKIDEMKSETIKDLKKTITTESQLSAFTNRTPAPSKVSKTS